MRCTLRGAHLKLQGMHAAWCTLHTCKVCNTHCVLLSVLYHTVPACTFHQFAHPLQIAPSWELYSMYIVQLHTLLDSILQSSDASSSFEKLKYRPLMLAGVHAWLCAPISNLAWLTSDQLVACWLKALQYIFHCESCASLPRVYKYLMIHHCALCTNAP